MKLIKLLKYFTGHFIAWNDHIQISIDFAIVANDIRNSA